MKTNTLPERIYLPQIAMRWEMEENETIALFIGRNVIFTMLENVQRKIILKDHIWEAVKEKAQEKDIEAPAPKAEYSVFLRVPVLDEYLETIIKQGYWNGSVFLHDFEGEEVEEIFQAGLVSDRGEGKNIKISLKDLYVCSTDLLKVEKELGSIYPAKEKLKKTELDPRSERTYLNIIGALLEVVTGTFKDENFSSETQLREFIAEKFDDLRGVAPRTLADKFALAKKALNGELD